MYFGMGENLVIGGVCVVSPLYLLKEYAKIPLAYSWNIPLEYSFGLFISHVLESHLPFLWHLKGIY